VRRCLALLAGGLLLSVAAAAPEGVAGGEEAQRLIVAEGLILFGAIFILAAALGMLRFPDFYTRLHASTKLVTLGSLGILGGAALVFSDVGAGERVLLIAAFFLLTAPLSGYMIAHAGYLSGMAPYREESSVDEWQECGALAGPVVSEAGEDMPAEVPNGPGAGGAGDERG
jgi:multicomponent Na+:H+ antiporter subunit G